MTGQAWFVLALAAGIVAVMPRLLLRDLRRAVARREARARTRARIAEMGRAFNAFGAAIGTAMLPVMGQAIRAAADMEKSMQQLKVTLSVDASQFTEQMQRLRKRLEERP